VLKPRSYRWSGLLALLGTLACSAPPAVGPPVPQANAPPPVSEPPATKPADASVAVDGSSAHEASMPVRREGAYANLDPSDDYVVGPPEEIPDCESQLRAAGVSFRAASLPIRTESKTKLVCGAPQVVSYLGGPGKIDYQPGPLLTCGMALALASFERILQAEAVRAFASPVARIAQVGTYSCRGIAAFKGMVSEHSYANAIDLTSFTLKNGKIFTVLRDFEKVPGLPLRPGGLFLRAASRRAFDEDVFSVVLTPFFNATHANHFHLDLARYRRDGTR
jgi:hypothetical protein